MAIRSYHKPIRCVICGRFIAYDDIIQDKVDTGYTPDTEFSAESIEHSHKACNRSEALCLSEHNGKETLKEVIGRP